MKRNWTQELSIVTLLDILKDLGVTSFMIPLLRPFLRREMPRFFEDVEFVGGEKIKDFLFEEEHVEIPLIAFDNDQVQASIPDNKLFQKNKLYKINSIYNFALLHTHKK